MYLNYNRRNKDKSKEEVIMGTFSDNLAKFRHQVGYTQKELANQIGITRTTYIKLERGLKSPTLDQINQLAKCLDVGIDYMIGSKAVDGNKPPKEAVELAEKINQKNHKLATKVSLDKLEAVLLYVLGKVGSQPNIGQTVIYKILYFIDFDFYEKHDRPITGLSYYHNHFGPTPGSTFNQLTASLIDAGKLQIVKTKFHDKPQIKYLANADPDLTSLTGQELVHIDEVLDRLSHKTASQISDYAHWDTPWVVTKPGQRIDYQLSKYRTDLTSVMPPEDEL